ncbi:aminopeptidase [Mycobacterium sp. CBMA293]|uniref:aminopeptidase n=1 Tax=unclassified Mycolicibacterium TaxID=2636767 RepID=UPI0012DFA039|nr:MULTISPECIES: aminopeptidase [unclassified Mycolicibacterium]MUL47076.1 aminopeptidase [Mycolicibacterium sp. CBMA 360]MUL58453.1 aminopeptidase [Mycolicibacterium sp. CBMA 335]MUL73911.1 aminopeptidase [Mycolicibacterium sp. CBMA 311]MUL93336.1 aminopeptidase [Mycolicibacterium sp. CBMA 230]MUM07883.1 aminopeptidase [Mycolicibacterium sp. CBMA 213]
MSVRRMILLAGAILLVVGIVGLLVPVSTADSDGKSIGCGNALVENLDQARSANASSIAGVPILNQIVPHTDYVAQCESALSSRRAWTIPVAIVGILVAAATLLIRGRIDTDATSTP